MRRIIITSVLLTLLLGGCGTVQSIIKSTFPYTAVMVLPADSKSDTPISVTSTTSSFDQIFGNNKGGSYVKNVKVALARLDAHEPVQQNLGIIKTVKLFMVNDTGTEVMVASRSDVSENIGNNLVLDIDNSRLIDNLIKSEQVKFRMEVVLRKELTSEVSVRAAVSLAASPGEKSD